jgi:NADH-quinone oxidoreductase subunit L
MRDFDLFMGRANYVTLNSPDVRTHLMDKYHVETFGALLAEQIKRPFLTYHFFGDASTHFSFPAPMVDALTAVMLVVVTVVSLMVQIYSLGYMQHEVPDNKPGDRGYHRYYAWMSLFTASMLGVVLANSLLLVFVFWELVGLCSYLLIGFWFHRPSAANAAKRTHWLDDS